MNIDSVKVKDTYVRERDVLQALDVVAAEVHEEVLDEDGAFGNVTVHGDQNSIGCDNTDLLLRLGRRLSAACHVGCGCVYECGWMWGNTAKSLLMFGVGSVGASTDVCLGCAVSEVSGSAEWGLYTHQARFPSKVCEGEVDREWRQQATRGGGAVRQPR
jgi:hypothetical protein